MLSRLYKVLVEAFAGPHRASGLMYHSAHNRKATLPAGTSLAFTPEESVPYLWKQDGYLHFVKLSGSPRLADETDIMRVAGGRGETGYVYDLADKPSIRKELVSQGYDGMRYHDSGPDNAYTHDTIVMLDPKKMRVVLVKKIIGGKIRDTEALRRISVVLRAAGLRFTDKDLAEIYDDLGSDATKEDILDWAESYL